MAIEVACVMAAGQAGLKSIPYFVDEFIARGISQLVPRPFDHENDQIQALDSEFRTNWTKDVLYGMGESQQLATRIDLEHPDIPRILGAINPIVAEKEETSSEVNDSPARLAAYCRAALKDECRKTLELWDTYKNLKDLRRADQLAVVIPFCPEGPTSGTVGMYLGATMIQCCREDGRDDVIVWGVELCPPPMLTGDPGKNAFRGYVAREEMLGGVPLSAEDPDDAARKQCFHINIAFDGGYSPPPYTAEEDILPALDRAAAQGIACLLTKAETGDKGETAAALRNGTGRWNACVVNVVCETSYSPALRCLGYRAELPWNKNAENWAKKGKAGQKKREFLKGIEDIGKLISDEEVPEVKDWFAQLSKVAEDLEKVGAKERFFNKRDQTLLQDAKQADVGFYSRLLQEDPPNDRVMVRSQPFCVSVGLDERLREDNARRIVDKIDPEHSKPLNEMLGIASSNAVQSAITDFCKQFLERRELDANAPSRAHFEEIRAISVRSDANRPNENRFRPTETALRAYLDAKARDLSPPYFLAHNLPDGKGASAPLRWKPFKVNQANNDRKFRTEEEVPVEYSFIVLARVRNGEGFRDLYGYSDLEKHHESTVNSAGWLDHAKYYAVRVPEKLLRQWEQQKRI